MSYEVMIWCNAETMYGVVIILFIEMIKATLHSSEPVIYRRALSHIPSPMRRQHASTSSQSRRKSSLCRFSQMKRFKAAARSLSGCAAYSTRPCRSPSFGLVDRLFVSTGYCGRSVILPVKGAGEGDEIPGLGLLVGGDGAVMGALKR